MLISDQFDAPRGSERLRRCFLALRFFSPCGFLSRRFFSTAGFLAAPPALAGPVLPSPALPSPVRRLQALSGACRAHSWLVLVDVTVVYHFSRCLVVVHCFLMGFDYFTILPVVHDCHMLSPFHTHTQCAQRW